jgi:hypothetical protein
MPEPDQVVYHGRRVWKRPLPKPGSTGPEAAERRWRRQYLAVLRGRRR